jgi:hypothetical protein
MANPNIVNVTTILGTTTYLTPANTTGNVLLSNASGSNLVFKINNIVAANVTSSAANTTVSIDNAAAGAGTDFPIVAAVSVPGNASLIAVDKTTSFYLMENQSIVVTSGTSGAITYTISYESIAS